MFNNARTLLYELHCWYAVYSALLNVIHIIY
jgi:hypothetical protein